MVNASRHRQNELIVAVPYQPTGFNEAYRNYTGGGGYFVANNIFNRLVIIDVHGDGAIRPDLAERWEILDGGRTYRFYLREAQWHDGAPLCSEDVRETYLTAIQHGYRAAASLTDVEDVVVIDDKTVDIKLREANAGFLAQLSIFVWTHILPAHIYAGTDWATNPANEQPIGTGPYRFAEWRRGEAVRVVANAGYHNGRPKLDAIEFRVVPDIHDGLAMLQRGDVDFCTQDVPCELLGDGGLPLGFEVNRIRGNALGHLSFNFSRTPWTDHRVRLAIAKLVDRDALARAVCTRARPARHAYMEHIGWAFNQDATYPTHDIAGAVALLDEAGLRPDADGVRLRGRMVCRDLSSYWVKTAQLLADAFANVGIAMKLDSLDPASWKEEISDARDFDIVIDGLGIGPDPVLFEEVLRGDSVLNVGSYLNQHLDDLFRRGKVAQTRHDRAEAYMAAQAVIAEDLPRIHLLLHGHHLGYSDRWRGWSWDPEVRGTLPAWSLEEVGPR